MLFIPLGMKLLMRKEENPPLSQFPSTAGARGGARRLLRSGEAARRGCTLASRPLHGVPLRVGSCTLHRAGVRATLRSTCTPARRVLPTLPG